MNGFVGFMRGSVGRLLRVVAGLVLAYWGFAADGGMLLGVVGILIFFAGVINFCIFAPLFGYDIWGKRKAA